MANLVNLSDVFFYKAIKLKAVIYFASQYNIPNFIYVKLVKASRERWRLLLAIVKINNEFINSYITLFCRNTKNEMREYTLAKIINILKLHVPYV